MTTEENIKDLAIGGTGIFATVTLSQVNTVLAFITAVLSVGLVLYRWKKELKNKNTNT